MNIHRLSIRSTANCFIFTTVVALFGSGCGSESPVPPDVSPAPFSIPAVNNVDPSVWVDFGPFTITGIDTEVNVIFPKGEVSIGTSGVYTSEPTTISNNQQLHYRLLSSAQSRGQEITWIRIGDLLKEVHLGTRNLDFDGDGKIDSKDEDIDNDGVINVRDPSPRNNRSSYLLRWTDPAPPMGIHNFKNVSIDLVKAADINHDGFMDIVGRSEENNLVWRKGVGNGDFAPIAILVEQIPGSIGSEFFQFFDLDEDGKSELIDFSGENPINVKVTKSGKVQLETLNEPTALKLLELDGIKYFLSIKSLIPVKKGTPEIPIADCESSPSNLGFRQSIVGDFQGLGHDQLLLNSDNTKLHLYQRMKGAYHCEVIEKTYDLSDTVDIQSADLDFDNIDELYFRKRKSVQHKAGLSQFKNPRIASYYLTVSPKTGAFGPAAMGDVDGDGDIDIVQTVSTGQFYKPVLFFNQGNGVFSDQELSSLVDDSSQNLEIADLNQDGIADILSNYGWYQGKSYKDLWLYPGTQLTIPFQAISDDGKQLSYSVTSSQKRWFSINPNTGDLSISIPSKGESETKYVDAMVRVSDGISSLHRKIRVRVSKNLSDYDGDGYNNTEDAFPHDKTDWTDLDGDGVGDNADTDDDGDGVHTEFDLDDTKKSIGQFPSWKNGGNSLLELTIPRSIGAPFALFTMKEISADLHGDGKDEIIAMGPDQRWLRTISLNAKREIDDQIIRNLERSCLIRDLVAHPDGAYAIFAEVCDSSYTQIYKIAYSDLSISKLARYESRTQAHLFARLMDKNQYVLSRNYGYLAPQGDRKLFHYLDESISDWAGPIPDLHAEHRLNKFSDNRYSPFRDLDGDGLDDFIGTTSEPEFKLNTGGGVFVNFEDKTKEPYKFGEVNQFSWDQRNNLVHRYTDNNSEFIQLVNSEDKDPTTVCQKQFAFASPKPITCSYTQLVDINQDGLLDLIGSTVWENLGNYTFAPVYTSGASSGRLSFGRYLLKGDFDGDGVVDFLKEYKNRNILLFWQDDVHKTVASGGFIQWSEPLDIPNNGTEVNYRIESGLDSKFFSVNSTNGDMAFNAPQNPEKDRVRYQCWLVAETPFGNTRKLLQVELTQML